jgi:hypothetical protein
MAKVLWTQKQDIGPRPRVGHAMVYDPVRSRVILFGGDPLDGTLHGDTWEWDGDSWTQVQDIGPTPRAFHAMAQDTVRVRSVLFGGRTQAGKAGDTWEWDGESWTQVADSGPAKRSGHAMVFDSNRQRVVLFGGFGGESETETVLGDTWEWDGSEWVQQEDTGPRPRLRPAMAFDPSRGRTVIFGGARAGPDGVGDTLGDTWEWDGNAWTQEADFGPDPCAGAAMASRGAGVALYGGISSLEPSGPPRPIFGLTWEWDGKHWTARQDMGPGPRFDHAMAFDTARLRIVLFGGLRPGDSPAAQRVTGDTWEQIQPGAPTGPGEPLVDILSLDAEPNPIQAGNTAVFTVTLSSPASASTNVALFVEGETTPFQAVPIAGGATFGSKTLPLPGALGAIPETPPLDVVITARSGASEASMTLSIQ